MTERGILFSAPMVRAILAGVKTHTRRLVHPRHSWHMGERSDGSAWPIYDAHVYAEPEPIEVPCPYGAPGDRLWVRETWRTDERTHNGEKCVDGILFRADDSFVKIANTRAAADLWVEAHDNGKHGDDWRPSIFMPRWASRLTLEIADVRVERLHAITEADARAEGMEPSEVHRCGGGWPGACHRYIEYGREVLCPVCGGSGYKAPAFREAFSQGWDAINGKRDGASWAANPWVWVLTFRRVQP